MMLYIAIITSGYVFQMSLLWTRPHRVNSALLWTRPVGLIVHYFGPGPIGIIVHYFGTDSYTNLTLPTNREV